MPLKWSFMMFSHNILLLLTTLLMTASCGKEPAKDPDNTPDNPPVPPVATRYIQDEGFRSMILHEGISYSVYLPADYDQDTETRYSVVYMLHGLGDNHNSWNGNYLHANARIQDLEARGLSKMIYVYPQGFSSYYCNFYDGSYNYMDMFVQEFIPLIDQKYRTIADKQHRAVTGYSMGGFGACALAEKHPELFEACAPLSMSVRTDWQYLEESQSGWNNQWGIIFGGVGMMGEARLTDYYKQHCPIHYFNAANKEQLSTVHWYLICGDDEKNLLYANDELHCVLRRGGYDHEYRVVDGGHSSSVWNPALDEVLPWFDYYMNGGTLWSPASGNTSAPGTVTRNEDGTFTSDKFKTDGKGTALFIVHQGEIPDGMMASVMYAVSMDPAFDSGYVLLPCDLTQKSLSAWMSSWEAKYAITKKLVLGYGKGAAAALALPSGTFKRSYYVNPDAGNKPNVAKDQEIYFCGTDDDSNYQGMNTLYNACKDQGAKFEYRIVNACEDPLQNILSSLKTIKSYIYY